MRSRSTSRVADGAIMQTIKTMMTSSLDQKILPDRPLVIGPAYTPNPELAGRPGGKLDVTNEAGCPPRHEYPWDCSRALHRRLNLRNFRALRRGRSSHLDARSRL